MRTIVIVCRENGARPGTFDVHDGTSFITELCWDELLGTIAVLTHPVLNTLEPRVPPYRLQSIDAVLEQSRELKRELRDMNVTISKSE